MCSSAVRFMVIQDGLALLRREQTGERAGLPQPRSLVARGAQEREQFRQGGRIQDLPPLAQDRGRVGAEPTLQVGARHLEKLWLRFQLRRHGFMERETTLVNPRVRTHGPSIVRIPGIDANVLSYVLAVRRKVPLVALLLLARRF